jgi:hypothetical protein
MILSNIENLLISECFGREVRVSPSAPTSPHLTSPCFSRGAPRRLNMLFGVGSGRGSAPRLLIPLTTDGSIAGADLHLSQRSLPEADIAPLPEQVSRLTFVDRKAISHVPRGRHCYKGLQSNAARSTSC